MKTSKPAGARGSGPIFTGKDKLDKACRYVGIVTPDGVAFLESARARLAKLAHRLPEKVSDGDLFEFLARGEKGTRAYLKRNQ